MYNVFQANNCGVLWLFCLNKWFFKVPHGKSVGRFIVEREVAGFITATLLILKQLSSEGTAFALHCSNYVERSVPSPVGDIKTVASVSTVEPRHNKGPRDWQNYFIRCNEVSLYRGSFSSILLLLGERKSFVIRRTSLYRGFTLLPCKIHSHLKLSRVMK